ncbi:MAG TPA: response regulator [Gemmatimonadales bacterium]|nr:response regulator [Gemmatimonadales bacterium]
MSGEQKSSQANVHPQSDGKPFVLVVDDDSLVRSLTSRILEASGFSTMGAEDGVAARDLINTGITPDLVLTDVKMPRMNGAELGRLLGQLRPGLPVVYMSGFASDSTDLLSPDILQNCFIEKPFSPVDLVAIVVRCLKTPKTSDAG